MKTKLLLTGLMGMVCLLIQGQQEWRRAIQNPHATYHDVVQHVEQYFTDHPEFVDDPAGGYKHYVRWRAYWDERVDESGSIDASQNAMPDDFIDLVVTSPRMMTCGATTI